MDDWIYYFIQGFLIGMVVCLLLFLSIPGGPYQIQLEFGNAICEENFGEGSVYESYDTRTKILICSEPDEEIDLYNGIMLRID